jgi:hypothetical protein
MRDGWKMDKRSGKRKRGRKDNDSDGAFNKRERRGRWRSVLNNEEGGMRKMGKW